MKKLISLLILLSWTTTTGAFAAGVDNWADLKTNLESGTDATLTDSILLTGAESRIDASANATLDLGTFAINGQGASSATNLIQATANNFIINNGTFKNVTRTTDWGSILHLTSNGNLTINGTSFTGNTSNTAGALSVGTAAGSITLNNVNFEGNSAGEIGAVGLYKAGVFNNVTFKNNRATNAEGDGTGALFLGSVSSATLGGNTVTDSLFEGNTSAARAGAIGMRDFDLGNNSGAKLDINNTTFKNNTAATKGGAIDNYFYNDAANDGYAKITNSTFTGNTAANGGAIYNNKGGSIKVGGQDQVGKLYVADSSFSGNKASGLGGAIYNEGELTLDGDNTFSENYQNWNGATGDKNDIYNTGKLTIKGTTTFDGGISGGGIVDIQGNVSFGDNADLVQEEVAIESGKSLTISQTSSLETKKLEGSGTLQNEGKVVLDLENSSDYTLANLDDNATTKTGETEVTVGTGRTVNLNPTKFRQNKMTTKGEGHLKLSGTNT